MSAISQSQPQPLPGEHSGSRDPGLAVCLASSFFGHYAHLGFLSSLEDAGFRPGRLAGASAGAMAAGLWAAGLGTETLEAVIYSLTFRRAFFDLGAFVRWPGVLTGLGGSGLLSGTRMRRYLRRLWGTPRIEELPAQGQGDRPRLEIAVTNLTRGRAEVRGEGPLNDFLIASCALPMLYRPQRIGGEDFLDGGVALETPFVHWLEDPSIHTILIHRIHHRSRMRGLPWRTPASVAAACHGAAAQELYQHRRQLAERAGKRVIFCETAHDHPGLWHRGRRSRGFYAAGQETARKHLLELGGREEVQSDQ